jgi:hypothetical protein
MKIKRRVLVVVAAVLLLVGAGTALGVSSFLGVGIEDVYVKTSNHEFSTTSARFVNVPNATVVASVPGNRAIRARFSAESSCGGGGGSVGDQCLARIVITPGGELNPRTPEGFAFDSFEATASPEAHSMERISDELAEDTYNAHVQVRVENGITFRLDDWTLSVETIPRGIGTG